MKGYKNLNNMALWLSRALVILVSEWWNGSTVFNVYYNYVALDKSITAYKGLGYWILYVKYIHKTNQWVVRLAVTFTHCHSLSNLEEPVKRLSHHGGNVGIILSLLHQVTGHLIYNKWWFNICMHGKHDRCCLGVIWQPAAVVACTKWIYIPTLGYQVTSYSHRLSDNS